MKKNTNREWDYWCYFKQPINLKKSGMSDSQRYPLFFNINSNLFFIKPKNNKIKYDIKSFPVVMGWL